MKIELSEETIEALRIILEKFMRYSGEPLKIMRAVYIRDDLLKQLNEEKKK